MSKISEFHRPISVARLASAPASYEIIATAAERAALAKRFQLLALDRLAAQVRLDRLPGACYRLSARLSAAVVQACIATLEPVASEVEEDFSVLYGALDETREVVLDSEAEPVEPFSDGAVNIGEAVAQQLSLALDPFPRAPGAELRSSTLAGLSPSLAQPFAILAKLRKDRDS